MLHKSRLRSEKSITTSCEDARKNQRAWEGTAALDKATLSQRFTRTTVLKRQELCSILKRKDSGVASTCRCNRGSAAILLGRKSGTLFGLFVYNAITADGLLRSKNLVKTHVSSNDWVALWISTVETVSQLPAFR